MEALLLGSKILTLLWEMSALLVLATFFAVASGVAAYVKGRLPGNWMIAGFFLGPAAFVFLLFHRDG